MNCHHFGCEFYPGFSIRVVGSMHGFIRSCSLHHYEARKRAGRD